MKTYLIYLDKNNERLEFMSRQLGEIGLEFV